MGFPDQTQVSDPSSAKTDWYMFRASPIARSVVGVLVSSESMHSSVTVPVLSAAAVNSAHFFKRHSSPEMNPPKCSKIVQRSRRGRTCRSLRSGMVYR